jgi:TRAP-type mannitol/chloroaromatic compound transport system permease small subunit
MQDKVEEQPAELPVAIYDPGEVGRETHTKGDRAVIHIANVIAWLFPLLMIAICSQVVLRQMGNNQPWLDDLQWWLYGTAGLVGVAYAVTTNSHVRVDIFYALFPERKKAWIDVFGLAWCFMPFILLCWDVTLGYALSSVISDEGSSSPNGLHNLWILKCIMNLAFVLTFFAVCSMYIRQMRKLGETRLGRLLLWAFPSVMFVVNLAVYYALYGYHFLNLPEDENARTILRKPIFDEVEVMGIWEVRYTIIITLVITILLISLALLRDSRGAK